MNLSRGIAWLVFAVVLFVCMDSISKFLTTRLPVTEIVWARYVVHFMAMLPVLLWHGTGRVVVTSRPGLQILRSLMLVGAAFMVNLGFRHLPLATVTAIGFATPLLVTAMAVVLLKEKVGPRRWIAVIVGFAGVLVVARPGSDGIDMVVLFPFAGALFNAGYQLATRALSGRDSTLTTVFWTGFGGCLATSPMIPWVWQAPGILEWCLLAIYGALGFFSHFMLILAYRHASASLLAPFYYLQLVLAMISGSILFQDQLDAGAFIGAGLICGSGLYVWHRQRLKTVNSA